jgi:sigma-B regulation protein RsbU (phosphoserine phosphatase)
VLYRTNQRILSDSSAVEFVTVFFAILDPTSATLTYANAGHNPPLVVDRVSGQVLNRLIRTGIPLGIENDWQWEQGEIHLAPNQLLILYTDGIPDTQNNCEEFYGMDCFEACIKQHAAQPVQNLQRALLADIAQFRGTALQFDDITLMCLARISDKG